MCRWPRRSSNIGLNWQPTVDRQRAFRWKRRRSRLSFPPPRLRHSLAGTARISTSEFSRSVPLAGPSRWPLQFRCDSAGFRLQPLAEKRSIMAILETARFEIPLLAAGQAHKELFHNEALTRIDFLIHPTVQGIESDPSNIEPLPGQSWLVAPGATNDWQGHDDHIAGWTGNGWAFIAPLAMMRVYIEPTASFAVYRGSWQPVEAIANPAAGSVVDNEARQAIDSILAALVAQGILLSGL
ncbi:hypothetical protein C8024_00865 [Sphingopyxis sp. BSNA05]|nr:hypothetical protein [Sphingopyxis sp. BSNA05]